MRGFAIVSEGVTDYSVLKNILIGWFKDQNKEPFVKGYQPDANAEGESTWQKFGNWENVFRYLSEKKYRDALEYADYLIIQIDTDQSEHVNYGVSQNEKGAQLEPSEMVNRVADKLRQIIGQSDVNFYGDKIIFAICVRELECWLLPLWDDQKADKCEGCLNALNRALRAKNERAINPDSKDSDIYDSISKDYRKRKILDGKGRQNPSLGIFLDNLERRNIILPQD